MGSIICSNVVSRFTANTDAFYAICGEIDSNIGTSIPQPILVIGQDGSGKTTLLKRLLMNYSTNHFVWIDGRYIFRSADIIEQITGNPILIIDNLDYFLNRCSYEEQFRLRRFLYNEGAPMMIASVSKLTAALTEYKAPFFEGIKKIHLSSINLDDISSLFDKKDIERATIMFNLLPPTINSVEVISHIIDLNDNPNNDIDLLLSYNSAIYKSIYMSLPTNSQHILNIIGSSDKGMTIPEIRDISGIASGILTSYFKSIKKQGIISIDKTIKRNTKYLIKDPLFRIWLRKNTYAPQRTNASIAGE